MSTANEEKIERYLRNTMSESEKSAFQFELMRDKSLREELAMMRRLQKALVAESRRPAQGGSRWSPWWLLTLFLLPAAYFFFNGENETTLPSTEPIEKVVPPTSPEDKKEEEKKEEEELPIEEEKSIEDILKPSQKEDKSTEAEIKQPIALADPADLVPNPLFEQMMTGVRSNQMIINSNSPNKNATLKWQQNLSITFQGEIETGEKPILNLLIFSNKKEDYENWNYFVQTAATIEKTDAGFTYFAQPTLSIKRGLYYYILENEETEEPVLTGKFTIK